MWVPVVEGVRGLMIQEPLQLPEGRHRGSSARQQYVRKATLEVSLRRGGWWWWGGGVKVPSTLTQSSPETNRDVVNTLQHLHTKERPLSG